MFLPTRGTPYDLRFSLFRIPVTVSPFFWVTSFILGFSWLHVEPGGPANVIAWILCAFVSVLLHEFGHALTMQAFGHDPEVVLHHFGGYATYRGRETPWRSLLITAAGPGIQLLLYVILVLSAFLFLRLDFSALLSFEVLLNLPSAIAGSFARADYFEFGTPLYAVIQSMLWINIIWPLFNLLPVLPLDGGKILWAILALAGIRDASDWVVKTSVVVGVIGAVYFLLGGNFIAGAFFAFMAMDNYQTMRGEKFGAV